VRETAKPVYLNQHVSRLLLKEKHLLFRPKHLFLTLVLLLKWLCSELRE